MRGNRRGQCHGREEGICIKAYRRTGQEVFAGCAHDPRDDGAFDDKEKAKAQLAKDAEAIDGLQDRLCAERTRALLVVLQGIDWSGKDGTVRGVFNTSGPLGVTVTALGVPVRSGIGA